MIAEFLYLDDDTILTWDKCYMSGGFDALERFDWKGGTSRMSATEEADLCNYFGCTMPRDTHEVCDYIRRIHGYIFSRFGAINLENFHCPVVEADRVNADSTIALFEKLEAGNRDKRCIHVVLDNARYHLCQRGKRAVKDWMRQIKSRINLISLPAYAPHLNAIERLWGVMHKYVTHNIFYSTYQQFAEAILAFFSRTVPKEWPKFRDTVTDNFLIISFKNFRVLE